jgi:3-phosphoshikimate 1-carboxyvinyltransferase
MQAKSKQLITPARNVAGALRPRGDKSISHRYAMLAALAEGSSKFTNFSTGADCASTLQCLRDCGVTADFADDGVLTITGAGGRLSAPNKPLDCGNSGSTMRMLSGILAGQGLDCELIGDTSLMRRPMKRIVEPLTRMGARISVGEQNRPPLRIASAQGRLRAIDYATPVASAQVKTCVLFAGLAADGTTSVSEPVRTRDHGELALRAFGAEITRTRDRVSIAGGQKLHSIEAAVPGDISSAAFFMCAAAIFPGSNLLIEGVGLNPTRAALLDVLKTLGAHIGIINLEEQHGELVGTLSIEGRELGAAKISGGTSAQLIDELPVLAAIAPYTQEGVEIHDAGELRVKESDRIALVAENLRRMGAEVTEFDDGLHVRGNQHLHGAEIDSGGDHRIAMAFAIAALRAAGESVIRGAEAAGISFPEFWDLLDRISER